MNAFAIIQGTSVHRFDASDLEMSLAGAKYAAAVTGSGRDGKWLAIELRARQRRQLLDSLDRSSAIFTTPPRELVEAALLLVVANPASAALRAKGHQGFIIEVTGSGTTRELRLISTPSRAAVAAVAARAGEGTPVVQAVQEDVARRLERKATEPGPTLEASRQS